MLKALAKVLLLSLLISITAPIQSQGAVLGAPCKKVGQEKKSKSGKLICKEVGKKKLWRKAAVKKKTTPENIEYVSADKAEVGKDCSIKGLFAATLDGPVKCDGKWNLVSRDADTVETRAYRYVLEEYLAQPEGELSIIWRIDPSTPEWKNQIETGMIAGARLWGTSPAGSAPRYSYVSHDPDWLFDKFKEDGLIQNESRRERMFQGLCNAGITGSDTQPRVSFWFYKFSNASCLNNVGFYQVPAHEYTHYAQEVLSSNNRFSENIGRLPWLDEGVASFIGAALGPMSDMPRNLQSMWAEQSRGAERGLLFFSESKDEVYGDSRWGDIYSIGALAAEAMTAVIGFKKLKDIYAEIGVVGASYESALTRVTGLGNAGWIEILQGYIGSVKLAQPWSLEFLLAEYAKKKG